MICFEDFQKATIELHKHINTLDAKFNIFWSTKKNEQIRLYKWITCETEESDDKLEERFVMNEEEKLEKERLDEECMG